MHRLYSFIMSAPSKVVGPRVFDQYDFIRMLCRTRSSRKCAKLISAATDEQLLTLVEIALNILKGRFPLKPRYHRKLEPLAESVRKLSRARSPEGARRTLQIGGNPLLSSLLIPIVFEVGRQLLSRNGA